MYVASAMRLIFCFAGKDIKWRQATSCVPRADEVHPRPPRRRAMQNRDIIVDEGVMASRHPGIQAEAHRLREKELTLPRK